MSDGLIAAVVIGGLVIWATCLLASIAEAERRIGRSLGVIEVFVFAMAFPYSLFFVLCIFPERSRK